MKKVCFYFWNFIICCVFGFIMETLWCILKNRKYESRKGLLYGPFIPIYGIAGMVLAIVITELDISALYLIFMLGFVISTVIEYIASYLQEKIFNSKSWDYSNFPLNLGGRINLLYSILFGLASLIWYISCYELSIKLFNKINYGLMEGVSILLFIFMLYNILISCIAVYRTKERRNKIERTGRFWQYIDRKYPDEKVLKVYANMDFIK